MENYVRYLVQNPEFTAKVVLSLVVFSAALFAGLVSIVYGLKSEIEKLETKIENLENSTMNWGL